MDSEFQLCKTLVVHWRFGKEHGEPDIFQINSPQVIAQHLDRKLDQFRTTPDDEWHWWQVDDDLIVERARSPYSGYRGPDTRFYYLIQRGLGVIENFHFSPCYPDWRWYIHLADIFYDSSRICWVMKDLFCDVIIHRDGFYHQVLDLADLAQVMEIGLITPAQARQILRRTEDLTDSIARRQFPTSEILKARAACQKLGWD